MQRPSRRRTGSSPRVRGALFPFDFRLTQIGIIPACAGSTSRASTTSTPTRDHPRVCGEHPPGISLPRFARGSSPRVRGALPVFDEDFQRRGIIPACAGSTIVDPTTQGVGEDHPRVCGEHRPDNQKVKRQLWIIPACAGSTWREHRRTSSSWDHPRVCGEHLLEYRATHLV